VAVQELTAQNLFSDPDWRKSGGTNQPMKSRYIYLALAVIGFVGPYYFFISFLVAHGFDGRLFLNQLFGSPISSFFAVDLLLASVVFVRYLGQESARHSIGYQWVFLIALLTVGLSFALPLFLYVRESRLESCSARATD